MDGPGGSGKESGTEFKPGESHLSYFQNNYEELTTFLRVPGAPIDNNIAEQALKAPVLIRKNAYFYRTS
ncbi:MAG: IS66 family transposase [Blastocatellia bacterium]